MSSSTYRTMQLIAARLIRALGCQVSGIIQNMRSRILIATLLCLSSVIVANAQRKNYVRIKENPLVRFEWGCTDPSLYPKAKLDRLVRPLLPKDWPPSVVWGDRTYAYDLNGDGAKEYFVPLFCGGTGNCKWAILSVNPARLLGTAWGESFYIHRRVGRWSRITISSHMNVSESMIDTYSFRNGRYRKFGRGYEASAYREDFPRLLLTVEPLCDPRYVRGSIRP